MTSFWPTLGCLRALEHRGLDWPLVAADLEDHTEVVTPCAGSETRVQVSASRFQAYCEPTVRAYEEGLVVLGVRPRVRAPATAEPVVGIEHRKPVHRGHGGSGTRWPTTWQELRARVLAVPGVTVENGGKREIIYHGDTQIASLPNHAGDRRALLNACQVLRAAGLDVRK